LKLGSASNTALRPAVMTMAPAPKDRSTTTIAAAQARRREVPAYTVRADDP